MSRSFLDHDEQLHLCAIVMEGLRDTILDRPYEPVDTRSLAGRFPRLLEPAGAFVTVYINDDLRGCLGEIDPPDPLAEVAKRCASRVPRFDYRFDPVMPDELPALTFKVSVLTPPVPISDVAEIVIGRDGLIAEHAMRRGLLLPDVASDRNWDVPTFLAQLRRKAGIPFDVPLSEISLERFETQIISGP